MGTLSEIMDGLAALIDTPNSYAYPVESISVPCTVVGYPTEVIFDLTYNRGGDKITLPVWYILGRSGSKDARDALSDAMTGVGSLKEALDGAHSFGDVRCTDASVEEITVAAVTYIAIKVKVEVI